MKDLNSLPKNVYDRLDYLEFMLRFRGWISRADLTERFSIGEAAATRDIRLYRELSECNLELNQSTKKYEIRSDTFAPLFEADIQTVFSKLRTSAISESLGMAETNGILCPPRLALPNIDHLSAVTRAISKKTGLKMTYRSVANGRSSKTLIPHSIFDNGIHWYVRAYDTKKGEYRSYALTRIVSIDSSFEVDIKERNHVVANDIQWNRIVTLELIPHPNKKYVPNPQTIEHDFNMKNGKCTVNLRATVAGYWLDLWNVDCSDNYELEGYRYQLGLKNHLALYDVESRKIAPGYKDPS